jgi:hypothetical protein
MCNTEAAVAQQRRGAGSAMEAAVAAAAWRQHGVSSGSSVASRAVATWRR